MAPLKVLITGAGIGGNALALWLSKLGHDVTVNERWSCLRANGLQVDLRGYGIQVMRHMGIEDKIRAKCVKEEGIKIVDSRNRQWAWFPANTSGKGAQSFSSEFEIMRSDLCQILYDEAVAQGAKFIFGTTVESFEETDDTVHVKFDNGSTDSFDLVCGADGLGSRLRKLMFAGADDNGASTTFTELPERTAYFTIPKPIEEGERYIAQAYITTNKRFAMIRRHSPKYIQAYLKCETNYDSVKNMKRGDAANEKAVFAEVFRNAGWKTDELIKGMHSADDWYCQYSGFVESKNWSKGHVTLVGDAAHGVPADGMGTSAALIGAYILAGEINRHCGTGQHNNGKEGIVTAIEAYERTFKPYIQVTQQGMSAEPSVFDRIPSNSFTVSCFLYLAWFVYLLRLDLILMRLFEDGGVKGFQLPTYEIVAK